MSTRRTKSLPPHLTQTTKPERGRCITAICFSWKVITCVVSHVTLVLLVVSYCVGGAYLFQHLEKPHEIKVKRDIHYMRLNLTEKIWRNSDNVSVLNEADWISEVKKDLATFEKHILTAMKSDGWDGDEDITKSQWTFAGSLFYSIIVITTIGYGHISPRTDGGKMTTIGYAIIGIPLMLLCLSNIGDIMATSFRFIYWRVCCYTCTRPANPKRSRGRYRNPRYYATSRSQPPPYRRSMMKLSMQSPHFRGSNMMTSYSDPELITTEPEKRLYLHPHDRIDPHHYYHYNSANLSRNFHYYDKCEIIPDDYHYFYGQTNKSPRFNHNRSRKHDRHTIERERYLSRSGQHFDSLDDLDQLASTTKRTLSVRSMRSTNAQREKMAKETRETRELNRLYSQQHQKSHHKMPPGRSKSVDAHASQAQYDDHHHRNGLNDDDDNEMIRNISIITNRYALQDMEEKERKQHKSNSHQQRMRSQSMPRPNTSHLNDRHKNDHSTKCYFPDDESLYNNKSNTALHTRRPSSAINTARHGNYLELPEFKIHQPSPMRRDHSPRYNEQFMEYDDGAAVGYYPDYHYADRRGRQQMNHNCDTENYLPSTIMHGSRLPPPPITHRYRERRFKKEKSERLPPSPRIMSPMGFAVNRQTRPRHNYEYDDDSWYSDEWNDYYYYHAGDMNASKDRPVPIWLCVFLVISYILGGAALFAYWEEWSFLDSAYFCFITLTTIGFGDFVPAKGVKDESEQSIAYCSLYLLFGIALLAMSFNLVQEEVIAKVKKVARRLGILKDEDDDDD